MYNKWTQTWRYQIQPFNKFTNRFSSVRNSMVWPVRILKMKNRQRRLLRLHTEEAKPLHLDNFAGNSGPSMAET